MSNAVSSTGILVKRAPMGDIVSSSVASPTVVTTRLPHGLTSGDQVTIAGHTSTPTINGAGRTVTVTSPTTFTVAVNVTVGGSAGGTFTGDTLVAIAEQTNVDPGGMSRNKVPTSTHNDGSESHVLGILRQDDPTLTVNYVGSEATHVQLMADIQNNRKSKWSIVYPSGVSRTGLGYLQRFKYLAAPVDGVQGAELAITWAGPVTELAA